MSIVNYLLSLSLLITSMGMLVDVFIKNEKNSHKECIQFEKLTHQKLQDFNSNQKGFGTLLGILCTATLSLIFVWYLMILKTENLEFINRKNIYLCFKSHLDLNNNFIKKIAESNIAILGFDIGNATGVLSAESSEALEALKLLQNTLFIQFIYQINHIKYCSSRETLLLNFHLPYQASSEFVLDRNLDQTTIVKEQSWKLIFTDTPQGVRYSKLFGLEVDYQLKNNISFSLQTKAKEISKADLWK